MEAGRDYEARGIFLFCDQLGSPVNAPLDETTWPSPSPEHRTQRKAKLRRQWINSRNQQQSAQNTS